MVHHPQSVAKTDDVVESLQEFFCTRLVKKGFRTAEGGVDGGELAVCGDEFGALVRGIVTSAGEGAVDADVWEADCEAFSQRWMHIAHWVCPVRLSEQIKAFGITLSWSGVLKERRRTPPEDFVRKKEKRERLAATVHTFRCTYCKVVCNSAGQMDAHRLGTRHKDLIRVVAREAQSRGKSFVEAPPVRSVVQDAKGGVVQAVGVAEVVDVATTAAASLLYDSVSCSSSEDVVEEAVEVVRPTGSERSPEQLAKLLVGIQQVLSSELQK